MLIGKRGESLTGKTCKSNPKIRESNWSKYFFLLVSKCSAASTSFPSGGESGGQDLGKAWWASWAMHVAQHCLQYISENQSMPKGHFNTLSRDYLNIDKNVSFNNKKWDNCCVFWPAFGCCAHLKAGLNTFLAVLVANTYTLHGITSLPPPS